MMYKNGGWIVDGKLYSIPQVDYSNGYYLIKGSYLSAIQLEEKQLFNEVRINLYETV